MLFRETLKYGSVFQLTYHKAMRRKNIKFRFICSSVRKLNPVKTLSLSYYLLYSLHFAKSTLYVVLLYFFQVLGFS